jgi:hypothetical protein
VEATDFSSAERALQDEIVRRLGIGQSGPNGIMCDASNLFCPNGHSNVLFDKASSTGNDFGISYHASCSAKDCSWAMSW